jgi:hypothetical protein
MPVSQLNNQANKRGAATMLDCIKRRHLFIAALAVACFGSFVISIASASAAPKGDFAVFADCPTSSSQACLFAKTESGKIVISKENVPIEKAIVLQGGLNEVSSGEFQMVAAKDGNTLSKSPQKVPGGLSGLVKCNEISNFIERVACEVTFENGLTGVTATTELAKPASSVTLNFLNYVSASGTALSLPIKVHLENPLLGSSCFVGTNSNPIIVNLTTGTSGAVTGSPGEQVERGEGQILDLEHSSLVNNVFSAPGANGCGGLFSFLIDPIINNRLGLPSASGKNTAVLNGKIELTSSEAVVEHE